MLGRQIPTERRIRRFNGAELGRIIAIRDRAPLAPRFGLWIGLALAAFLLAGCVKEGVPRVEPRTFVWQGCQYLEFGFGDSTSVAHKGNCTNKVHEPVRLLFLPETEREAAPSQRLQKWGDVF